MKQIARCDWLPEWARWSYILNLPLSNLPSYCAGGEMFNVNHALSCKKGGFIAQRHDTIRDLLPSHMSKVCRNLETEPLLQPLDNEIFNIQSTLACLVVAALVISTT